jgi:hypothetical protein
MLSILVAVLVTVLVVSLLSLVGIVFLVTKDGILSKILSEWVTFAAFTKSDIRIRNFVMSLSPVRFPPILGKWSLK